MRDQLEKFLKLDKKIKIGVLTLPSVVVLLTIVLLFAFRGGGEPPPELVEEYFPEIIAAPTPPPTIQADPDEYEDDDEIIDLGPVSILTGVLLYEEYLYRRPLAVVINNMHRAQPQSGIASADIVYEVLAEGDITRLVAVFHSYIPEKIGPVRSTRDYFTDLALNHDAIFIHHGGSPTGYSRLRDLGVDAIDGMRQGRVFWRDRTYPEWALNTGTRALEHSSFTGREHILSYLESGTFRDYLSDDKNDFGFYFGDTPDGVYHNGIANRVVVPFSRNYTRTFIFDEETGLYLVENRDGPHLDAINQEQVAVANVLIQFANMRVIDDAGRRSVDTVGEGVGYLVTGGRHYPVLWAKDSHTAPARWYFENGEPVVLNPGATWICIFQSNGTVEFE